MIARGSVGKSEVLIPRASDAFISFNCIRPITVSYNVKALILGMKVSLSDITSYHITLMLITYHTIGSESRQRDLSQDQHRGNPLSTTSGNC